MKTWRPLLSPSLVTDSLQNVIPLIFCFTDLDSKTIAWLDWLIYLYKTFKKMSGKDLSPY